jgi:hypothetical protein
MDKNTYIKADDNVLINEKCIKWVEKMDECLYICTKSNGCNRNGNILKDNMHKLCKQNNYENYLKLNKYFE